MSLKAVLGATFYLSRAAVINTATIFVAHLAAEKYGKSSSLTKDQ